MKKPSHQTIAIVLALVLGVSLTTWTFLLKQSDTEVKDDVVFSREVVAYEFLPQGEGQESVVKYEYKGDKVPEKITPKEDVSKRTETSYHQLIALENEGTKDEKRTYEGVFYTQPTFFNDGGEWYYIEHATTTESAFNKVRNEKAFASLFWRTAHAASLSPFSTAGDGWVYNSENGDSEIHTVTYPDCADDEFIVNQSLTANHTNTTSLVFAKYRLATGAGVCDEQFTYLPFDTSSITAGSTVTAATLNIYVTAKVNGVNDGSDYIDVSEASQASNSSLATTDYESMNQQGGLATTIDIGSITTSAYNVFTLNSTGRAAIKTAGQTSACGGTSGYTCLGLIEGHMPSSSMTNQVNGNSITLSTSENTGTSQDPYLSITYTPGANFALWQFQDY
jgi:hypothetical protein